MIGKRSIWSKVISKFNSFFILPNCLGKFGRTSTILSGVKIKNHKSIFIDENVVIDKGAWLYAHNSNAQLMIDYGCQIGRFFHCTTGSSVHIHQNVLIAERVFITDMNHEYQRIDIPIHEQGIYVKKNVEIGEGTWLGEGVCIIGSSVGKNCVIGANSVITMDVDDYCVVCGNPGKIVKRYNHETKEWESVCH